MDIETAEGVKADESKIRAILDMPSPTDISGVKRLCDIDQYMAKFLPDLAETMESIRALTRNDTEFQWSAQREDLLKKLNNKSGHTSTSVFDKDEHFY